MFQSAGGADCQMRSSCGLLERRSVSPDDCRLESTRITLDHDKMLSGGATFVSVSND